MVEIEDSLILRQKRGPVMRMVVNEIGFLRPRIAEGFR